MKTRTYQRRWIRRSAAAALTGAIILTGNAGLATPQAWSAPSLPQPTYDGDTIRDLFATAEAGSTLVFPEGTYQLDDYIELPREPDVTIDASDAIFTGKVKFVSAENSGLRWSGGYFQGNSTSYLGFALFHVQDARFEGMTFDQARPFGFHTFDLMGCQGIIFDGLSMLGYGNTVDVDPLDWGAKAKGAIQIDMAGTGSSGDPRINEIIEDAGGVYDDFPTKSVIIENSSFLPAYEGDDVIAWGPIPTEQHASTANDRNESIVFRNNIVRDTIPLRNMPSDFGTGAIYFMAIAGLTIEDNVFSSTEAAQREHWIQLINNTNDANADSKMPTEDVLIAGNVFEGAPPTRAFVSLVSDTANERATIDGVRLERNRDATTAVENVQWVEVGGVESQIRHLTVESNERVPAFWTDQDVAPAGGTLSLVSTRWPADTEVTVSLAEGDGIPELSTQALAAAEDGERVVRTDGNGTFPEDAALVIPTDTQAGLYTIVAAADDVWATAPVDIYAPIIAVAGTVAAGKCLTVSSAGWLANSNVSLRVLDSVGSLVGDKVSMTADDHGSLSSDVEVCLPADTSSGEYVVEALDDTGARVTAEIDLVAGSEPTPGEEPDDSDTGAGSGGSQSGGDLPSAEDVDSPSGEGSDPDPVAGDKGGDSEGSVDSQNGTRLPDTGSNALPLVLSAVLLVLAGVGLFLRRRRNLTG